MSPPRAYSKRAGQNSPFAIRKNMPASCPPFRFQYSAVAQRWAGKAEYFSCTKDFPQNAAKKNGAFAIDADCKKECRYTFVAGGQKARRERRLVPSFPVCPHIRNFGGRQRVGGMFQKEPRGIFTLSAAEAEKAPPPVKKRGGERNSKRVSARHSESKK